MSCKVLGCMWGRSVFPSGTSCFWAIVHFEWHSELPGDQENLVQTSPLIPTVCFPHLINRVIQDFSPKPQQPCTSEGKPFQNEGCTQRSDRGYMAIRKPFPAETKAEEQLPKAMQYKWDRQLLLTTNKMPKPTRIHLRLPVLLRRSC